ncbi:hypothetical protein GCM10009765_47670 [Fodinicola feengrottensis]|uniref:Uncharacterized protein n=1 Tax=Fodinicola feengrottensis TaxID=435914 RepID=A0ABN2HSS2_9ACTN
MTGERRKQGTLYRLDLPAHSRTALYGGLSEQYVNDPAFAVDTVSIGTADGLVIRGVSGHAAEWCDAATVLTGFGVDLSASSAGCAILLVLDGQSYAFTYGPLGRRLLDQSQIDRGFGLRYAAAAAPQPEVDDTIRAALRSPRPSMEAFENVVPRLERHLREARVPVNGTRSAGTTGTDGLILDIVANPVTLLADIRAVATMLAYGPQHPELDFVTHVRPLAADSPLAGALDEQLAALLAGERPEAPLSWRHDLCLDNPAGYLESASYGLTVGTVESGERDDLRVEDIHAGLRDVPADQRCAALREGTIRVTNETGMPKLTLTAPADHWIVAEIALPEFRYLYYRGAWHQIHNQFLTALARGEDSTLTTMMQLGLHRLVSTAADRRSRHTIVRAFAA